MKRILSMALLTVTLFALATAPARANPNIVIGASGNVEGLSNYTGKALPAHLFGVLDDSAPDVGGKFINIEPDDTKTTWKKITNGDNNSQIDKWASTFKNATANDVYWVSFSHEPMTEVGKLGNSDDFKAAWKYVYNRFAAKGVTNVKWVWNVSGRSWEDPNDVKYAPKWYPGNSWVDFVSSESYNYFTCKNQGWESFESNLAPAITFTRDKGKPFIVGEFASMRDNSDSTRRSAWLNHAETYMRQNNDVIRGAFWFASQNADACPFNLEQDQSSKAAWRSLVNNL